MAKDKSTKKQRRREQLKIHKTNKNSKKIVKAKGKRKKDVKRLDKETASVYKFSQIAMPNQSEMSIESERNEENVRKERVIEVISDSDDSMKEATVINLDSDDLESDVDISELDQTDIDKGEDEKPTQVEDKCDDEQEGQQKTEKVLNVKFFPVEGDHDIIGVLLVKPLSVVAINGKFILQVLKGKLSIHGYETSPFTEPVSIFSSKSTGLLQINDTSEHIPDDFNITFEENLKELFVDEWESILREIESHSSVGLLKKLPMCQVDFALNFKPYQNLAPLSGKVDLINPEDPHILKVRRWQVTAKEIITTLKHYKDDDNFRVLLCGSKNTGKSTFARFLANSVLNSSSRVFFLECDVGQTEFTPPGLVSLSEVCIPLLGPPFTHQTRPVRSHFFGNTSPRDDPTLYVRCIHEAFQFYMEYHRQGGPLIINTQGWMKGIGLSLLIDVIRITTPNMVLQFKTQQEVEKDFCPLSQEFVDTQPGWAYDPARSNATTLAMSTNTKYFVVQAPNENLSRTRSMKAADYRRLSLYTYFGHLFYRTLYDSKSTRRNYMIKRPINSLVPRIVYWKDVAVHVMHHNVPPSSIIASVTFSLVSLAKVDQNQILDLPEKILPDGPRFIRKNPVAVHIGFGFIRNVDISKKAFIVLTPVPVDLLGEVNTFLKGNLNLPVELFNQDSSISTPYCIPDVQSSIRGSRARKPRYNLKRRKFDASACATGPS